jgi:hypothetical protein
VNVVKKGSAAQKLGIAADRIEKDRIILNGRGKFPKKVIIREPGKINKEYRLIRTTKGGYLLT